MSNPFDVHSEIRRIFEKATPVSRFERQKAVERSIVDLAPDFIEAAEILDALTASLERRYEQDIADVLHEAKQLREALMEADATEEREHDEMTNRLYQISERSE